MAGIGLVVAATVSAVVVTGYWYSIASRLLAQEHVFITGTGESTASLSDGSLVSLSAHSILTVDDTGPQRVAFQEAGEIIYKVKGTPTRPFTLQTIRATAIVVAEATFRVAIGRREIEIEVLAGVVKVAVKGEKPGAPARRLRKGDSMRVSVDGMSSVFADRRGSARASVDG